MSAADVLPSPRENWRRRTTLGKVLFPAWAFTWCFWYVAVSVALALIDVSHVNVYRDADDLDDRAQAALDDRNGLFILALLALIIGVRQVVVGLL